MAALAEGRVWADVAADLGVSRGAVESWAQGRRRPSPGAWSRLQAVAAGDPVEVREARIVEMTARAERGEDLQTGAPARPRRALAELVLEAGLAGELGAEAARVDRREAEQEERDADREAAGLPLEEDQGDDEDHEPGSLLRALLGRGAAGA